MARRSSSTNSQSVYASEDQLRTALKKYLLTHGQDEMKRLIGDLIFLHRSRSHIGPVRISGKHGFFRDLIEKLVVHWGVDVSSKAVEENQSRTLHEVRIPAFDDRTDDWPIMVAFVLRTTVDNFANSPDMLPMEYVDLDLLWFLLAYTGWEDYENVKLVIELAVGRAPGKNLSCFPTITAAERKLKNLKGWLRDLIRVQPKDYDKRVLLRNLIGCYGRQRLGGQLVEWYLNWDETEATRGDFQLRVPQIPLTCACQAMTNLYHLHRIGSIEKVPPAEREKVKKCLHLRRQGLPEREVAVQLKFESIESYDEWTENNHINIRFNRKDTVHDDHRRAERFLFQDISKPQQQDTSEDRTVKILKIMEDDSTIVVGEKKYNLPDKFFKAVRHLALQHVDGNPSVEKHRIYEVCDITQAWIQSISVKKWFLKHRGEAKRFAEDGLIESLPNGNCRLTIPAESIQIVPARDDNSSKKI